MKKAILINNNTMKNEGFLDRLIRLLLGGSAIIYAYLWTGGTVSIIFYIIGAVMLFTAATGFCLIYKPFHFNTLEQGKDFRIWFKTLLIFIIVLILAVMAYVTLFITKKKFLEDYSYMNNYYKQTLYLTGQNQRDAAIQNYNKLVSSFTDFKSKYIVYKPYAIKSDKMFNGDVEKADSIISGLKDAVNTGDLSAAHKQFEDIRPIFQDILKRNGFSMLAVALVDFHDTMEEMLTPADEKDNIGVIAVYSRVDQKLKEVEAISDDEEIQTIRKNLEALKKAADEKKSDELPSLGAQLKSSFVKVYLKRG